MCIKIRLIFFIESTRQYSFTNFLVIFFFFNFTVYFSFSFFQSNIPTAAGVQVNCSCHSSNSLYNILSTKHNPRYLFLFVYSTSILLLFAVSWNNIQCRFHWFHQRDLNDPLPNHKKQNDKIKYFKKTIQCI